MTRHQTSGGIVLVTVSIVVLEGGATILRPRPVRVTRYQVSGGAVLFVEASIIVLGAKWLFFCGVECER